MSTRNKLTKPSPTQAQQIFAGKQLITSRPEGMNFDDYRFLRKTQDLIIKSLFKHCPDRNLSRITSSRLDKTPLATTKKGVRRIMRQRKSS